MGNSLNNRINKEGDVKTIMAVIGGLFFIFGFITWINGILIPFLRIACGVSEAVAYFVTFSFYISYTIMAIPSGFILKKTGMVNGMSIGFFVMAVGCSVFIPAAYSRSFLLFLLGLFITGTGLTILQRASNPYLTLLGPAESAGRRISIMGLCNKLAGIAAPLILAGVLLGKANGIVSQLESGDEDNRIVLLQELGESIIVPYIIIGGILFLLSFLIRLVRLPEVRLKPEDVSLPTVRSFAAYKRIIMGFLAIFCAVGAEVMAGDTISNYGLYHNMGLDTAKNLTSYTLSAMLLGYLAGVFLIPRFLKQDKLFLYAAVLGLLSSVLVILVPGLPSVYLLAFSGMANAIFWPSIWPIALRNLNEVQANRMSSLLIMGIAGGAIIPLIYGALLHWVNNQWAYCILIPCYLYLIIYRATNNDNDKK